MRAHQISLSLNSVVIRYYFGIIKKLSVPKVFNLLKLNMGFHISRLLKQPLQFGMPLFVSVEPTTSCNLRCPQCPSGLREFSRPTGMLQNQLFENIILQLKRNLHSLTFYFQGEPYLNPDFLRMVNFANSNNVYTITSTNAHYLSQENAQRTILSKLDELIISIDGTTQETYKEYRMGGDLEKVINGTKEILNQKKLLKSKVPHVVWQFVVFKANEHQINDIKKLGKEMGVNEVRIKTAQIYDFENSTGLIPEQEKYSRYRKTKGGSYEIKNKLLNQCWRMWQGCVITWDGKIVPCCFDKDAKYKLGDLNSSAFEEIWFSDAYNQFRGSVLTGRDQIDICRNCSEGTKVWA